MHPRRVEVDRAASRLPVPHTALKRRLGGISGTSTARRTTRRLGPGRGCSVLTRLLRARYGSSPRLTAPQLRSSCPRITEVKCSRCGHEEPAMKTVRPRSGGASFLLCDACYSPLAPSLWIVAGHLAVHGKCRVCSGWFSLRELEDTRPGGKWDAPSGRRLGHPISDGFDDPDTKIFGVGFHGLHNGLRQPCRSIVMVSAVGGQPSCARTYSES